RRAPAHRRAPVVHDGRPGRGAALRRDRGRALGYPRLVRAGRPDLDRLRRARALGSRVAAARGEVKAAGRLVAPGEVAAVTLVVLGGSIQVFYFTSILPHVLPGLGVDAERTLEVGGVLIFVSGVAAALGALAVPRLGELFPERRLIAGLLMASS